MSPATRKVCWQCVFLWASIITVLLGAWGVFHHAAP